MVQSDALSRQPDLCPDEDTDNENIVMLPDEMFINLIDMDLQNQIAIANDIDSDAAEALRLLLEEPNLAFTRSDPFFDHFSPFWLCAWQEKCIFPSFF